MNAVRAIYENGVFRPLEPVDLPEASEVLVTSATPRALRPAEPGELDEMYAILGRRHRSGGHDAAALRPQSPEARARVPEILGRRHDSGEHDVAERHNEHQP